jgi:hypothetical protein
MAKDKSKAANQPQSAPQNAPPAGNVVQMPSRCPVDACGKKAHRSDFCEMHFEWFKEGLINRQGMKPRDFDKKMQAYTKRHKSAA